MTQKFENIESEWPIFYSFLIIDGVFKGLGDQVEKYQTFLKRRLIYTEKGGSKVTFLSHSDL
jgi:phosphorylase kinase alpha/beta subunit